MARTTTAAGTRIFKRDLAGMIGRKLGPNAMDATLTKRVKGTRTSGAQAAGTNPTTTAYTCKGFRSEEATPGGRTITARLLGATILSGTDRVVPEPGDLVTIGGETFEIAGDAAGKVKHDGASACYICVGSLPGPGRR